MNEYICNCGFNTNDFFEANTHIEDHPDHEIRHRIVDKIKSCVI